MEQTNVLSQEEQEDTLRGKYLIFSMGSELFGIEIRYITEIIGMQPITVIPEMPDYVKGVTNLRGKIIPVMDARLRFKKEAKEYNDRTCIIVIDTNDVFFGLIVDSVSEVETMQETDIVPPPELNINGDKYVKGIGKSGKGVKILLDCHKLVTASIAEELNALS